MPKLFALCGDHENILARHQEDFVLGPAANVLTGSHVNPQDENLEKDRDCQEKPLRLWLLQ